MYIINIIFKIFDYNDDGDLSYIAFENIKQKVLVRRADILSF